MNLLYEFLKTRKGSLFSAMSRLAHVHGGRRDRVLREVLREVLRRRLHALPALGARSRRSRPSSRHTTEAPPKGPLFHPVRRRHSGRRRRRRLKTRLFFLLKKRLLQRGSL